MGSAANAATYGAERMFVCARECVDANADDFLLAALSPSLQLAAAREAPSREACCIRLLLDNPVSFAPPPPPRTTALSAGAP